MKLLDKLSEIHKQLQIDSNTDSKTKISIISNYIKSNVKIRQQYFEVFNGQSKTFDNNELIYRTAYGALIKGEAMCARIFRSC